MFDASKHKIWGLKPNQNIQKLYKIDRFAQNITGSTHFSIIEHSFQKIPKSWEVCLHFTWFVNKAENFVYKQLTSISSKQAWWKVNKTADKHFLQTSMVKSKQIIILSLNFWNCEFSTQNLSPIDAKLTPNQFVRISPRLTTTLDKFYREISAILGLLLQSLNLTRKRWDKFFHWQTAQKLKNLLKHLHFEQIYLFSKVFECFG